MISSTGSRLVAIVRDRLEYCEDEQLVIAATALCDGFEEMSKSMDDASNMIDYFLGK